MHAPHSTPSVGLRVLASGLIASMLLHAATGQSTSLSFTTFAGSSSYGTADGSGSAARFDAPIGVATDSSGNVYIADRFNHAVRKITPGGDVTTLAGLPGVSGSANGSGSAARFSEPLGVAVDSVGNVYVADSQNHAIRKITPAGVVSTFAGALGISGSANGAADVARFDEPNGVAVDADGNVYVADSDNNTIRKITAAGVVSTLAGLALANGTADGTGSAARFRYPTSIALDGAGNLYVTDYNNHTIRRVTQAGVVTTLAGQPATAGALDATGAAARFSRPAGIARESADSFLVVEETNCTVRRVTTAGVVTTVAGFTGARGSSDGTGTAARFNEPGGIALDGAGNAFIADSDSNTIRKMTPAREVTTLAGVAGGPGSDNGPGTAARFQRPQGIAVDSAGNLYVGDTDNHTIRKISPAGVVETFAGSSGSTGTIDGTGTAARFNAPEGVAVDGAGNVYVADTANHTIRKITPGAVVSLLAGQAGTPGTTDGIGAAARFRFPSGVAVDSGGTVYVADTYNHTIRKIAPDGTVTTLAGSAGQRGSANGTGTAARFNFPYGIDVHTDGTVYVTDSVLDGAVATGGHIVRKITAAGEVTTLAGQAGSAGAADGVGSAARFFYPFGLALDAAGNVFVAEYWNNVVRRIAPDGAVTTVAGPPGGAAAGIPYNTAGAGSAARFFGPIGVAVGMDGALYVADTYNHTIRKGVATSGQLSNLSVRSNAGTGSQTLIVGFTIGGSGAKQVLVRGIGPTLADFGVSGALADPQLKLYDTANNLLQENDDWGGTTILSNAFDAVGAFGLGTASKDAAILPGLSAGGYTAQITSTSGTGIALVETYDTSPTSGAARLTNVSARTVVGTGGEVLIVGFYVTGSGPKSVLIRAIGPALSDFGVTGVLADPRLDLYSGATRIGGSDNWDRTTLFIPSGVVGAFELTAGSKDAAILATLTPGDYTVQVSGVGGTTGVALVELYEMP